MSITLQLPLPPDTCVVCGATEPGMCATISGVCLSFCARPCFSHSLDTTWTDMVKRIIAEVATGERKAYDRGYRAAVMGEARVYGEVLPITPWAMGYTDATGTVVVDCDQGAFGDNDNATDYLGASAPRGLWYWEGTIRGWQCPEGDHDTEAVGKFSLTTAKCVGEREAPDDEFPIAEEP